MAAGINGNRLNIWNQRFVISSFLGKRPILRSPDHERRHVDTPILGSGKLQLDECLRRFMKAR